MKRSYWACCALLGLLDFFGRFAGNALESDDGFEEPLGSGIWNYFVTREVPSGTHVIVDAFATDCLGGMGTLSEWITIP